MSVRQKLRILVVDDMSTSRGIILQALDALRIPQVEHAEDGVAGLASIARRPVHLVISDYNMPKMDGLRFLQAIRANAAMARTGFILVSGRSSPEILEAGRKLRMNNFLKKPFDMAALKAAIEDVAGRL